MRNMWISRTHTPPTDINILLSFLLLWGGFVTKSVTFSRAEFKWTCYTSAHVAVRIRPNSASSTAQISSAQKEQGWGGVRDGGGVLSDFTADSRAERAWTESPMCPIPHRIGDCNANSQPGAVTTRGPLPGNYAWPFSFNRHRAVGIHMRHRSPHEPLALYCWLFFKWQPLSRNNADGRGAQSVLNRQVTDRDVIGKAVSNEPAKRSGRAITGGLLQGLAPLTLGKTSQEPVLWCDLSLGAETFLDILSFTFNYWNALQRLLQHQGHGNGNILYSLRKMMRSGFTIHE